MDLTVVVDTDPAVNTETANIDRLGPYTLTCCLAQGVCGSSAEHTPAFFSRPGQFLFSPLADMWAGQFLV